jgi:hypothetical protein
MRFQKSQPAGAATLAPPSAHEDYNNDYNHGDGTSTKTTTTTTHPRRRTLGYRHLRATPNASARYFNLAYPPTGIFKHD